MHVDRYLLMGFFDRVGVLRIREIDLRTVGNGNGRKIGMVMIVNDSQSDEDRGHEREKGIGSTIRVGRGTRGGEEMETTILGIIARETEEIRMGTETETDGIRTASIVLHAVSVTEKARRGTGMIDESESEIEETETETATEVERLRTVSRFI